MRLIVSETGLSIREPKIPTEDLNKFSPKQIESWLATLPRANTGEMAKQIYTLLSHSNGLLLDPAMRMKFLFCLQPEFERLYQTLEKHFHNTSAALNPKQTKIAELARALLNEQALAYKAIIDQLLKNLKGTPNKKILGPAMAYAMYYLSRLIGHCYQLYLTPPKKLWHELHTLFQLAEFNSLDTFITNLPKPVKSATLRNIYKSSLLLALANPNQLRTNDFWALQFDALDLSKLIKLTHSISILPLSDEYEYVVNLRANTAPFHRSLLTDDNDHDFMGINVQNLLIYLQTCLENAQKRPKELSTILIRHLINALGNMSTRSFSRTPCQDAMEISVGLAATHSLIKKGTRINLNNGPRGPHDNAHEDALTTLEGSLKEVALLDKKEAMISHFALDNYGSVEREQNSDSWSKQFKPKVSINDSETLQKEYHLTSTKKNKELSHKDYQKIKASILNISPGGYCLTLNGMLPKQIQTDEVIGILERDETGKEIWNIGIIRWIKRESNERLLTGIQLIAPNAEPVTTSLRKNSELPAVSHSSLLLPSLPHIGQPATLLTPTLPYKVGKMISFCTETYTSEVKLEKLLQEGRSYSRFTFRELSSEKKAKKTENKEINDSMDDFSSVWEIL